MSLSAWEQRALHSIESKLAGSDPELTMLVAAFTELASGEEMPATERVTARTWLASRNAWRRRRAWASRWHRRLATRWAALLLLLLTAIALISVALAFSRGGTGRDACATPWIASCASPAPTVRSAPATHAS
jgi:hypothetical protein